MILLAFNIKFLCFSLFQAAQQCLVDLMKSVRFLFAVSFSLLWTFLFVLKLDKHVSK